MTLSLELRKRYEEAIKSHFRKNLYDYDWIDVQHAVLNLMEYRDKYDSIEDCLEKIYPKRRE